MHFPECQDIIYKSILIIFNVVVGIVGVFLAWLGGILQTAFEKGLTALSAPVYVKQILRMLVDTLGVNILQTLAVFLLIVSIFLLLISIFGIAGSVFQHPFCLCIFMVLMGLLLAAELGLVISTAGGKASLQRSLENGLIKTMPLYEGAGMHYVSGVLKWSDPDSGVVSYPWDYMHVQVGCCGVNGTGLWAESFNASYLLPSTTTVIASKFPLSCCATNSTSSVLRDASGITFIDANSCLTSSTAAYTNTKGCVQALFDEIWTVMLVPVGIMGGIIGVQIVEIVCAVCLIYTAREGSLV